MPTPKKPQSKSITLFQFIRKWKPESVEAQIQFLDDLRMLLILDKVQFREDQKSHFTDKTGDKYLANCLSNAGLREELEALNLQDLVYQK